jgi:flagellar hook-associated protein 3 FlgL
MLVRNTLSSIYDHREALHKIQDRIATQKRIQKPSDDPVGYSRVKRFRTSLSQNEQFLKNISFSKSWVDTTTVSLEQLHDFAIQAKDIATQGADGSADAEIRSGLALNLRGIFNEALSIANSQYMGKSLFAGTNTNNPQPFTLQAGTVVYSGNDQEIQRKISQNITVSINVPGQDIMDTNLFDSMLTLITALETDDVTGIQNSIDAMSAVAEGMLNLSTASGSLTKSLNLVETRLNTANVNLISYISEEEDASLEEEIVKYEAQETAYQAALQSAISVMNLNILLYVQ